MSSENLAVAPVVMRQTFITFPFFPLDSGISNNAIKCAEDYTDIVSVNERALELPYRVSIKTRVSIKRVLIKIRVRAAKKWRL
jgi:hypothetical protein